LLSTGRRQQLRVAGLFAGIGGIELGLHDAGHSAVLLCEIDKPAASVLKVRFPDIPLERDILELQELPESDLVAAGFPCQDLSQAGRTAGITGAKSSLVNQVFKLIARHKTKATWLMLENVPFMLQLDRGEAMRHLTEKLAELKMTWAYRVVDTRAFGLPQRRLRVILLASKTEDPRRILFSDDAEVQLPLVEDGIAYGFYWTEGNTGLGWAINAIPTLKSGSAIGIASPPAVVMPDGKVVVPGITDAERLQGFEAGWTEPALDPANGRLGVRWRLVGNAVSVPVARWVGNHLAEPADLVTRVETRLSSSSRWPIAAWGRGNESYKVEISSWPVSEPYQPLATFLRDPAPLSARAADGFYRRLVKSSLRKPPALIEALEAHLNQATPASPV
jgi:DNA (cytosine-5)-methyltransferase 1